MNTEIQTTTPNKPTGISPPEVPLGIQGTFLNKAGPEKLDLDLGQMRLDNLLFLETFEIVTSDEIGTAKHSFSTQVGLPLSTYTFEKISGTQVVVPWNMIPAYYSRLSKVDFELHYQPVKVSDCRVSMDFVMNYNNGSLTYDERTLVNNNVHYLFDDPIQCLDLPVPMFWPTLNVHTNSRIYVDDTTQEVYKSQFIPRTKVEGFIAAPYIKNALQPTQLPVVVWLSLKPRQVQGASAMKNMSYAGTKPFKPFTFLPLPYWYEKPVITKP